MQTKPNGEYFSIPEREESNNLGIIVLSFEKGKQKHLAWHPNQNKPNKNAIEILISKRTMFKKNINYIS